MSSIPLISNEEQSSYSVIGNNQLSTDKNSIPITVVIINRGENLGNEKLYESLSSIAIHDIISIETTGQNKEFQNSLLKYDALRFIVADEKTSVGETINFAMTEALNPWVLVMWNDMTLTLSAINANFVDRVRKSESLFINPLCCSPNNQIIPSISMPFSYKRNRLKISMGNVLSNNSESLFPFQYCALYNKQKFFEIEGFDPKFKQSNYWQLVDFGIRTYMYGFHTSSDSQFRLVCPAITFQDSTVNEDYNLFYLKNLGFRYIPNQSYLPYSKFFSMKNGLGLGERWALFKELRAYVASNREKIKIPAIELVEKWGQA